MGGAIGKLFGGGGLTQPNSALQDPSGKSTFIGNPNQVLAQTNKLLQQQAAPAGGNPLNPPDPNQPPLPRIGQPSFQEAASVGAVPGMGNALSPGLNKAGKLATLLMSGLQGALAGRAKSEETVAATGGRRAGGVGMGFEAGYTLPWQRAQMQQQLQQEQAKTGLMQAQTKMAGTSMPITLPGGQQIYVPARQLGQILRGLPAAQVGAQSREDVATGQEASQQKIAQMRIDAEQLKFAIQNGQISKVTDGIDPATGQPAKLAFDRMGRPMGVLPGSLPSAAYLPQSTNTIDYKEDVDGNILALPKPTTKQTVLPAGVGGPRQLPAAGGGVGSPTAKPVLGPGGKPIQSAAGAKAGAKWMSWDENGRMVAGPMSMARQRSAQNPAEVPAQEVRDITNARHAVQLMTKQGDPKKPETNGVLQLVDSLDKDGKLGVAASRWNSFMTTGVGTTPGDDPRIMTLINKNMLGDTATMLAHFGASGGRSPQMLQHFLDLANARKMDGITLRAGLKAMVDYMQDRAQIPSAITPQTAGGGFAAWKNSQNAQRP